MGNSESNNGSPSHSSQSPEHNVDIHLDDFNIQARPQQIRNLKCDFCIQKNSLNISTVDNRDYTLFFKYDSEKDCTATFYLAAKDEPGREISLYFKRI